MDVSQSRSGNAASTATEQPAPRRRPKLRNRRGRGTGSRPSSLKRPHSDAHVLASILGEPTEPSEGPASPHGLGFLSACCLVALYFVNPAYQNVHLAGVVFPALLLTLVASQPHAWNSRFVTIIFITVASLAFTCLEYTLPMRPIVTVGVLVLLPVIMRLREDSIALFLAPSTLIHAYQAARPALATPGIGVIDALIASGALLDVCIVAILALASVIITRTDPVPGRGRHSWLGLGNASDSNASPDQTLATHNALLRRQWSRSPFSIMVCSEGKIIYANAPCLALIGATLDTVAGRGVRDFVTLKSPDTPGYSATNTYLSECRDAPTFLPMFGSDSEGNIFPGSVAKLADRYHDKQVMVLHILSHPEGNLVSSLLGEIQSKVGDLFKDSNIPMVHMDGDSKIVEVNSAAQSFLGTSSSALIGQRPEDPGVRDSDVLSSVLADMGRAPSADGAPVVSRLSLQQGKGGDSFLEWSRLPVRDEQGKVTGSILCFDPTPPASPTATSTDPLQTAFKKASAQPITPLAKSKRSMKQSSTMPPRKPAPLVQSDSMYESEDDLSRIQVKLSQYETGSDGWKRTRTSTKLARQRSASELQSAPAKKFPRVTVLCIGLDNPSTIYSVLRPDQCVQLLSDLFALVQDLCLKHHLVMTKTMGSRCLVVGGIGLSEGLDSHRVAESMANLALDLRHRVATGFRPTESYSKPIALRMGLHAGKVVAGRFACDDAYDVTGECVDRVCSLEAECVPGRILVSQVVFDMLSGKFVFYSGKSGGTPISASAPSESDSPTQLYCLVDRVSSDVQKSPKLLSKSSSLLTSKSSMSHIITVDPPSIVSVMTQEQQSKIDTVLFDVWWFTDDQLIHIGVSLFHRLGLVKSLSIPTDKLSHFILSVCQTYRDVPYHNFHHAMDVAHAMYVFIKTANLDERFTDVQQLALIVSALCHDLGHPGLNNRYQTLSNSTLALRYNYRSVLEQHHASLAFRILSSPDSDITANMTAQAKSQVRDIVVTTILSTDMAFHANYVKKGNALGEVTKDRTLTDDELQLLFCCHLKAADIFNICRPFDIARTWAEKLQVEFLKQGDLERQKDLPVLPFMDRTKHPHVANGQVNFINMMGEGFIKTFASLMPVYTPYHTQCLSNVKDWANLLETTYWDHDLDKLVDNTE